MSPRLRALLRRAWVVAAAASLLARTPALGAAETGASSSELRKSAEEAFREGDFRAALARYHTLAAADPDPALLYNIARCHHELGELPEAYDYYARFAIAAPAELRAKVPHLDEKIAYVAAHTALLEIRADVLGALVTVDGRIVGKTGELGPTRVHEGKLVIDASKEGHASAHRTIEASGGTTVKVELALPPVVSTGVLQITSSTSSTTVVVDDGAPVLAPASVVLPPGEHRVVATASGVEPWRGTLTVTAGRTTTQVISFEPSSSHPWLWAGVGVAVVATGIVVGYALLTERSAGHGSYSPGQISAGVVRF